MASSYGALADAPRKNNGGKYTQQLFLISYLVLLFSGSDS